MLSFIPLSLHHTYVAIHRPIFFNFITQFLRIWLVSYTRHWLSEWHWPYFYRNPPRTWATISFLLLVRTSPIWRPVILFIQRTTSGPMWSSMGITWGSSTTGKRLFFFVSENLTWCAFEGSRCNYWLWVFHTRVSTNSLPRRQLKWLGHDHSRMVTGVLLAAFTR